ncbi:FadR/GntR family transcriptional regulator [Desulfospira joergensenii]|uniref:FadR/GntR family transcriptional regulator n=1 Tax=Desulfospira joergensenii TaxID=53329 RepID=UPI0003B5988E|nr:FCD domain-containing protein [Desulfospira joergensenii]
MTPFSKDIEKPRGLKALVEQIQDLVFSGRKGDRLPSERELAGIFHTGRPVVREALRILEVKGLIRIRPGRAGGIFIALGMDQMVTDHLKLLMQSRRISLNHLVEFRRELEGQAALNAAIKADDKDILQLKSGIEKIRECAAGPGKDVPGFIRADTDFHLKLSMIDGNPCNTHILQAIYNLNEYFGRFVRIGKYEIEKNLEDLSNLLEAVLTHKGEAAKSLAVKHINRFKSYPDLGYL